MRRLLTAVAVAAVAIVPVAMVSAEAQGAGDDRGLGPPRDEPLIEDLGPAVTGFPVNSAAKIDDRLYIFALGLQPARFVEYDLADDTVTRTVEIPTGQRIWATTTYGDELYFGMWGTTSGEDNFYRYHTNTGQLEALGRIDTGREFWTLDTDAEGNVFAGGSRPDRVFVYERATGAIETIEFDDPEDRHVAALQVTDETVFVGLSRPSAGVFAIDRDTEEVTDLTPEQLRDGTGVYDLAVEGDRLVATTWQSPAHVAMIDLSSGTDRTAEIPTDGIAGAIALDASGAYFSGIHSGVLHHWAAGADAPEPIAEPVANAPTRANVLVDGELVGAHAPGIVSRYALDSGDLSLVNLLDAGAEGAPEPPQSLAVSDDVAYVGTNNAVQLNPVDGGDPERIVVSGEAKAMTMVDETVYIALYPAGLLWRYDPAVGEPEQLVDWPDIENRPRVIHHDAHNGLVLVGTHADTRPGGSLVVYDPADDDFEFFENPLGDQTVEAVTSQRGTAFLGGLSAGSTTVTEQTSFDHPAALHAEGVDSLAQSFVADEEFNSVAGRFPTWQADDSAATLSLYDGVDGDLLAQRRLDPVEDNAWAAVTTDKPLPPGEYYLELSDERGTVGWWSHSEDRLADGQAFVNGQPVEGDRTLRVEHIEGALLAAVDPQSGEEDWRVTPVPDAQRITGLAADERFVYGLTAAGTFFVVDPDTREVIHRDEVLASSAGELRLFDRMLYAVSMDELVKIDPRQFTVEEVVDDLNANVFTRPMISADGEGRLYLFREFNLLRVTDDNRPRRVDP